MTAVLNERFIGRSISTASAAEKPRNCLPIFFNNASDVGLVFMFTWLYEHTRGSVLIAIAFHASANMWTTVLAIPSASAAFTWVMAAVRVGILFSWG